MSRENRSRKLHLPKPGAWRDDEVAASSFISPHEDLTSVESNPDAEEHSQLLQILGLINFKILNGNQLYIETNGTAYKVLYGAYWRSVFSGSEHYLLKCEEIPRGMWIEGDDATKEVDLSIRYTNDGWLVKGHSLKFMAFCD
jgi:hypothetical protein